MSGNPSCLKSRYDPLGSALLGTPPRVCEVNSRILIEPRETNPRIAAVAPEAIGPVPGDRSRLRSFHRRDRGFDEAVESECRFLGQRFRARRRLTVVHRENPRVVAARAATA